MALVKVPGFLSVPTGGIIQSAYSENTTTAFACTTLVSGTHPNITGGDEICNAVITPTKATNVIEIIATLTVQIGAAGFNRAVCWVQQDTVTPVRASSDLGTGDTANAAYESYPVTLRKRFVAGSTSALTFRLYGGYRTGSTAFLVNPYGGEATLIINELEA